NTLTTRNVMLFPYTTLFRSRIGVEDRNKPIGLRKRKRTEQNGIDHRKDREVRSQTDRDRGERGDRKRRCFAELAKGEAKIVHEQDRKSTRLNSSHGSISYAV